MHELTQRAERCNKELDLLLEEISKNGQSQDEEFSLGTSNYYEDEKENEEIETCKIK